MASIWLYSLLSVFIVSLISFIGVFTLGIETKRLRLFLIYIISFSAGALFGDAFIHLLPDIVSKEGFSFIISIYILTGIVLFFILEKIVHAQLYHNHEHEKRAKPFGYVSLTGGALHNFIDGLIISSSYLISIPAGIATTVAVVLHEIPHELGDFGILVHAGFSRGKALFINFLTALTAVLGAIAALWLSSFVNALAFVLVPIAAGGFIYIAGSDLIPELHKEGGGFLCSFLQLIFFILGIAIMFLLLLIGGG